MLILSQQSAKILDIIMIGVSMFVKYKVVTVLNWKYDGYSLDNRI